jgi:hypothetical protein
MRTTGYVELKLSAVMFILVYQCGIVNYRICGAQALCCDVYPGLPMWDFFSQKSLGKLFYEN